jgi:hypothetical protein
MQTSVGDAGRGDELWEGSQGQVRASLPARGVVLFTFSGRMTPELVLKIRVSGDLKIMRGTPTPPGTPQQVPVRERGGINAWLIIICAFIILIVSFIMLKKLKTSYNLRDD